MARPGMLLASGALSALALVGAAPAASQAASAAASAGPAAIVHVAHGAATPGSVSDYTSDNWDGYFVSDSSQGTDFTAISSEWTEPSITCPTKQSWAGFWIGFDGWYDTSVEQGGTEASCTSGSPRYSVWWEMYPYNDVETSFAISPGDKIEASVTYSASTRDFSIVVKDLMSGQTLSRSSACHSDQSGCQRSSAEVISEDIGGGPDTDGLYYLPDYGTATYADTSVTNTAGHTGTLSDPAWNAGQITEVTTTNVQKQSTSALAGGGAGFSTTWLHD